MKTTVLIVFWFTAAFALILILFSAPGDGGNTTSQAADESFIDRAVRTRLNTDHERDIENATDESFLNRAIRTRAGDLIERTESQL